MGIAEILAIISGASHLIKTGIEIVERMQREGRTDPTPAEIARLKADQFQAEEDWAAQLARLKAKG